MLTDKENDAEELFLENEDYRMEVALLRKEIAVLKENPTTVNNVQVKIRVDKFADSYNQI